MSHPFIKKHRSWFHSPIIAIVLVLFVILGGISVIRAGAKEREAVALRNQYRDELREMDQRESELSAQIHSLSTERGLEAEIRERYRVSKPGEELVVMVDNGDDNSDDKILTFWEKIRLFVGI